MNRSDRIALIARSYANGQANRDNEGSGTVKRAFLRRLAVFAALNALPIVLFIVLLLMAGGVAVVLYSILEDSSDDKSAGLSDSYGPGMSFREQFTTDFQTIPYGIPVERAIVGMAIDQRKYRDKDKYWLAAYDSHMGQDFSRVYSDKSAWYLPYLFSTLKWVAYLVEKRREDPENPANYLYERDTLVNGEYVRTSRTIRKDRADMVDPTYRKNYVPYWQRVVIASLDGKFYVQYAHMSSVRPDLLSTGGFIDRGDSIGIMGSTGNSSGVHLHYEVLYCGENNEFPELRTDTSCEKVNPFGYYEPLGGNFLWFDPKGGAFVVWGSSARMSMAVGESEAMDELKRLYKGFCGNYGLDEESCKKTYPVVRASQWNPDYPPIEDPADAEKTAWKYLARKYGVIEGIPDPGKVLQVVTAENLQTAFDWNGIIGQLSGKMSHGKYLDSGAAYRIRDAGSSNAKDSAAALEEAMDRLLELARKNWGDMEKSYLEFYGNAGYQPKGNPYVYNLSDKTSIFLEIRKSDGTPIRKFTWYGALATYRKL